MISCSPIAVNCAEESLKPVSGDYDYRQRFTMTGTYLIPGKKTSGQMLEGWQLNSALRGQRLRVWDVSLAKNWKIKERFTAQFRVECFNVINAVNYAGNGGTNPSTPSTFGVSPGTPDVVNSAPVFGTGGLRKIQLGAKLIF
jgi:hypothetical protein